MLHIRQILEGYKKRLETEKAEVRTLSSIEGRRTKEEGKIVLQIQKNRYS